MREKSTTLVPFKPTKILTSTDNLQEAAWIMHKAEEQDLSGFTLQLKDGQPQLEFVFTDGGHCRNYHCDYFFMKDREPEEWSRGIENGLSKLNKYLNGVLTCGRAINQLIPTTLGSL